VHAIKVLREDHARIERLLDELAGGGLVGELSERLSKELVVHTLAEDNVFLPQVQEAIEDSRRTTEEFFDGNPEVLAQASGQIAHCFENNVWIQDLLRRQPPESANQDVEDLRKAVARHIELEESLFPRAQEVLEEEDFERIGDLIEHCKWQVRGLAQARLASSSSFRPSPVEVTLLE
jgi:hemerythrin superfamily protein